MKRLLLLQKSLLAVSHKLRNIEMNQKSIAVIGGGISSLSFALNLAQKTNFKEDIIQIKIFEKKYKVGGRIQAEESPEDEQHHILCADVGANYIDFESQQQKKYLQTNLPKSLVSNFKAFDGKFLIYENSKLKEPQYQKTRYFYQGGFNHMAEDWKKQIQAQKTLTFNVSHHQVSKVQKQNDKWKIVYNGKQKEKQMKSQLFDILIFGTPAPQCKQILQNSKIENSKPIIEELNKIRYTKQFSAIFEVQQKQSSSQNPYSILLIDHQLTFICFHQQKYPSNQRNIAVIQTNEEFTEKYCKKLQCQQKDFQINHNQIQKQIAQEIWKLIPEQIKQKCKFTKKCLGVHFWPQSLLKPVTQIQGKQKYFDLWNSQLNSEIKNKQGKQNMYFTGDYLNNKSRVTGAIAVGIRLSQQIVNQHFSVEKKAKV